MTSWSALYEKPLARRWWPCEELVRSTANRRFRHALEVGCGNGANLWHLAEHATDVLGLDLSGIALMLARDYMEYRGKTNVAFRLHDLLAAPIPSDSSFDLVVDCMTSQHVPWDRHGDLYREYARVMAHGGVLLLYHLDRFTTCGGDWSRGVDTTIDLFPEIDLVCLPTRQALIDLVASAGFTIVSVRGLRKEYGDQSSLDQFASYTMIEAEKT